MLPRGIKKHDKGLYTNQRNFITFGTIRVCISEHKIASY